MPVDMRVSVCVGAAMNALIIRDSIPIAELALEVAGSDPVLPDTASGDGAAMDSIARSSMPARRRPISKQVQYDTCCDSSWAIQFGITWQISCQIA